MPMSKSEVLYVKGMNYSESDVGLQADDDIWDDTHLNNAYDKAIRMANVEVAKRIAMSTNSKKNDDKDAASKNKGNKPKKTVKKWAPGASCRAVYEGDGLEYEAFVFRIVNDKECLVRFLGYDNSEIVPLESLKPTRGKEAQQQQIEQALLDQEESGISQLSSDNEQSDRRNATSPGSAERTPAKKSKSKKKKGEQRPVMNKSIMNNGFLLPELPMPDLSKLSHLGSMDIPMPPPPLALGGERVQCEEQAVSSMLLSWYMSGYYTGLYQGLKRSKQGKRNKD